MKTKNLFIILTFSILLVFFALGNTSVFATNYYSFISLYNPHEQADGISILAEGNVNNSALEGVSYDESTNTLNLKNVVTEYGIGFNEMGTDFKINVEGNNSIAHLLGYAGALTITGDGTLTINENKTVENAIMIAGESASAKIVVASSVTLNLSASENVIVISGSSVTDEASAITLQNGQTITVVKEKDSYEMPKSITAIMPSEYENSYTLCTKDDKVYGRGRSITMAVKDENGDFITDEDGNNVYKPGCYLSPMIYVEENDIYIADETVDRIWVLNEEFDSLGYVDSGESISTKYVASEYMSNCAVSVDANGKEYGAYSTYMNGEQHTYVYDIAEDKVTLGDGKEYSILILNETVEAASLTDVTEKIETNYFNYIVKATSLNVEPKVEEENNEEEKTDETDKTEETVKEEETKNETEKTEEATKEEETKNETEKTEEAVKEEETKNETENKTEEKVIIVEAEETDDKVETAATEQVKALITEVLSGEKVSGISEDLAEKIVTAINEGKSVKVEVSSQAIDKSKVEEDAKKVEEKISTVAKVASYFDISVLVKVDSEVQGKVTKLNDKIAVTVSIPKDIPEVAAGYTREYLVIRVHDGVAEELPTTVSGENVTFETDAFSTYALTYKDVYTLTNPSTGDSILVFALVAMVSIVSLFVIAKKVLSAKKDM